VNKKPGAAMDTLTAEFLKFIASKEGQEIVVKDGYFPIPAKVAAEDQAILSGKK
jgi:phosphate transport system substrate-binding protein